MYGCDIYIIHIRYISRSWLSCASIMHGLILIQMSFLCSSMLAELLGSDMSLLSARHTSPRGGKSATAQRKTEELKKWRKEHQNKVKEKYNEELARKRKPEARPFSSEKALVILVLMGNLFSF